MATKRTKTPKPHSTLTAEALGMAAGRSRVAVKSAGGSLNRRAVAPGQVERVALWLDQDLALQLRQRAAALKMSLSVAARRPCGPGWRPAGSRGGDYPFTYLNQR